MDREALEYLLSQNMLPIKEFVKVLFEKCETQINELKVENGELRRSLEFSQAEISALKSQVTEVSKAASDTNAVEIPTRVMRLEDFTRKDNLRINGVTEQAGENSEQTLFKVREFVKSKLGLDETAVLSAHRVGATNRNLPQPRTVIAKLSSNEQRNNCLRNSSKLMGTNIFINEDVSPATQAIRNSKMDELRAKRQQGYIAYFSGTRIICKPRRSPGVPPVAGGSMQRIHDTVATDGTATADTADAARPEDVTMDAEVPSGTATAVVPKVGPGADHAAVKPDGRGRRGRKHYLSCCEYKLFNDSSPC